jgi:hypothetical protein
VIVGCTDRKTLTPSDSLRARNLEEDSVENGISTWCANYQNAVKVDKNSKSLGDLYSGEYWKVARDLGDSAEVLVASAGLGLHHLEDRAVGYSATFCSGVLDSIVRWSDRPPSETRRTWWNALAASEVSSFNLNDIEPERVVILAVSESYQQAMADDLRKIAEKCRVVTVSGSNQILELTDVPGINHIQVRAELRIILGGSVGTIGVRFVREFLKNSLEPSFEEAISCRDQLMKRYGELSEEQKLPTIKRDKFESDKDVENWICNLIEERNIDSPTKSRLLRILRDEEKRACEQKRFGRIFDTVINQASKS